jgi:hypothetical protein
LNVSYEFLKLFPLRLFTVGHVDILALASRRNLMACRNW